MKSWSYGLNGYYKVAHICLHEAPFYIFSLDWLASCICEFIPAIPFPKLPLKLSVEDAEYCGMERWTTWKDWYGDLNQFVHCHFHDPVFQFCQARMNEKWVEMEYEKLKEIFYKEDKKFWDDEEKFGEEMKKEEEN